MTGLGVLGAGLSDGIPDGWDVDRLTLAAVAPAFGAAVGRHAALAAGLLTEAADGRELSGPAEPADGLGVLTCDATLPGRWWPDSSSGPTASRWLQRAGGSPVGPAVAGLAGFVAAREYGQRLAYALHGFEARGRAAERQIDWAWYVALPADLVPGIGGRSRRLEPFAAHAMGADGTWENGVDRGARYTPDAAAAITSGQLTAGQRALAPELDQQARAAYLATATRLGAPVPPVSPVWDATGPLLDGGPGLDDVERLRSNAKRALLRHLPR